MAKLTTQYISSTGMAPTFAAAAAGGDTFANNGNVILYIKNGGTTAITVTVDSIEKCSHGFDHNIEVSIPATSERMIGPFDAARFNNKATGLTSITYSAVATVTVAVLQL